MVFTLVYAFLGCTLVSHNVAAELSFAEDGHIFKRITPITEQYTVITLSLKTIDATGVLLYMFGSGKRDFFTLELIHGRLRYAADFGSGPLNEREPEPGYHEMYIDMDLADNDWHHLEIHKKINEIKLVLDKNGDSLHRRTAYMKVQFGARSDFTYDEIFVAGLNSFYRTNLKRSLSQRNIKACIGYATLNGKTVLDGAWSGNIGNSCPQIRYSPVSFPSAVSHLQLPSYVQDSIKLSLMFRTVVNQQVMLNHTNRLGDRIELSVTRYGKIALSVDISDTPRVIESWKRDYQDGRWHQVEFMIPSEAPYIATLIVDNNVRKTDLTMPFKFNGLVNFGFGFTGCMRELKLNDVELDVKSLRPAGSVMYDDCHVRDFCTPNPCLNGGRCNQTDMTFFCECRHTDFNGTACDKPRFNYTCGQIFERGDKRSDVYHLDVDGIGPMPTMKVFCRMGDTADEAVTQLNTTLHRNGVPVISQSSDYKAITVPYLVGEENIRELIMHSDTCSQEMKYICKRSRLFNSPLAVGGGSAADNSQARWIGEDNRVHYYWAGAKGRRNYCACGITNSCVDRSRWCNCDARSEDRLEDKGFLTIKEHLPVRKAEFFDVNVNAGSSGHFTIGPLACKGFGGRNIAMTFRERFSYVELEPMDKDGLVDAGMLSIEFKTAMPTGVLFYSRGPVTRDYVMMELVSPTRMRLSINIGADMEYRDIILEVDVSNLGITLDDNNWHNATVTFNRKDLEFGIHNITRVMSFWYRDGVSHLNIDGNPVYLGANPGELSKGFVGCVRNVYVMGRLQNLPKWSKFVPNTGVYNGCGAACKLIDNPCNNGFCIDKYTHYTCNCSVSSMQGNHCHIEPYSHLFASTSKLTFNYPSAVKPTVSDIIVTFGFKTQLAEAFFFQLLGADDRYIVGSMYNGTIQVFVELRGASGVSSADVVTLSPTAQIKFNDDKRHDLRVHLRAGTVTVELSDLPTLKPASRKLIGSSLNFTGFSQILLGASFKPISSLPGSVPRSFTGCSSGAKVLIYPNENGTQTVLNLYEMLVNGSSGFGESSINKGVCGDPLPQAATLPTLTPPDSYASFTTVRPKFGNALPFDDDKAVIVAIAVILVIFVLIVLILIIIFLHRNYSKFKKADEAVNLIPMQSKQGPTNGSRQPAPSAAYKPAGAAAAPVAVKTAPAAEEKKQDWFI